MSTATRSNLKPAGPRSQADRSASTRAALADAAIEVLLERGWAAVTAAEVCQRVGVSRGAFHHHYASLPSLLADALRRLYAEMGNEPRTAVTSVRGLIDANWRRIGNPRFKAILEAWLAMNNDPSLRDEVGPVVADFAALVRPDVIAPAILTTKDRRAFYAIARETMIGLALGRATNGGQPLGHERTVLAGLRADATALDDGTTRGARS